MRKLDKLLDEDKNKWIKDNLLEILGLLNLGNESILIAEKYFRSYRFTIPLSIENLIYNMQRVTQHHESLVIEDIKEFIKNFKGYFVLNQKEFVYTTETGNTKKHPPSNCEITINGKFQKITHPDTSKSQTELILKQDLLELAKNSVSNQKFDSNIILNKIKTEMTSVKDLLYLAILSKIFEINKSQNFYNYDGDAKYDLSVVMEISNIDEDVINKCLGFEGVFEVYIEKLLKFLPKNQKSFSIFYSHNFNTNTCYMTNNIHINPSLSKVLFVELEKIPIAEKLEETYTDIKQNLLKNEERCPLFDYKDEEFLFMNKYRSIFLDEFKKSKIFNFQLEDNELKALHKLIDKKILKIQNDEILLNSNERFDAYYETLRNKETDRINKNVLEITYRWLKIEIDINAPLKQIVKNKIYERKQEIEKIEVQKCPECGGKIPPLRVKEYLDGKDIICMYCNYLISKRL